MEKSRLLLVLRSLQKKEWRALGKWLYSPAHNLRKDTQRLYEYFDEKDRLQDDNACKKENAWTFLFPEEPFDDARFRQTMHFMLEAVESFLTYEAHENDPFRKRLTLAEVYRKLKVEKAYLKTLGEARHIHEKNPHKNALYHQHAYYLETETYEYKSIQRSDLNLQEMSDALDLSFIAGKLRQSVLMLAHQQVVKTQYDTGLLEPVLAYVEQRDLLHVPAIALYYYGYRALTQRQEPAHFLHLKEQLISHGALFPHEELRDLFLMAINYCIGQLNAGREEFNKEAFNLYQEGFRSKVLIDNGTVSQWTFLNTVNIGLKIHESEYLDQFIPTYQEFLEPRRRDTVVDFALAQLGYYRQEYKTAMQYLARLDTDDTLLLLRAKILLAKMYYEQEELVALESLLESMRTYVARKQLLSYHKTNLQHFIRLTRRLIRLTPGNKKQKTELAQDIQDAKPMTADDKKWLTDRLLEF